ncbi:MAG: hypothetical protein OSB41_06045 [Kiritimatiellae bacterium]|nr:hypothetical protein [Kiritimatiellia bacterium]
MYGLLRFFLALMLLPLCAAFTSTAIDLIDLAQPLGERAIPESAWALGGGYVLWLLLFFTMPRPVRTYVLAHELTHALWAALMGARVSKLKVTRTGGSVTVSKSNFLITLAPYFFPLYTALVIVLYWALGWFMPVADYYIAWLALVGFTWGFHFTFTVTTLLQRQSDVEEYGHVFSYVIIYMMNVLGVCLWVLAVADPDFETFARKVTAYAVEYYGLLIDTAWGLIASWKDRLPY